MYEATMSTINRYLTFYGDYFLQQWAHMTPIKYGTLLIGVGVLGWILMKSSQKKC